MRRRNILLALKRFRAIIWLHNNNCSCNLRLDPVHAQVCLSNQSVAVSRCSVTLHDHSLETYMIPDESYKYHTINDTSCVISTNYKAEWMLFSYR